MYQKYFRFFILILLCSHNANSQVDLNNGLVAYYPFNGNSNDESGNNRNGQLVNGVQLTSDRFGNANNAYLFDGIDDYIKVTDNGGLSSPQFSIAIWFQSQSSDLQNLIGKRDFSKPSGSGGSQYQLFINYPPFPGIGSNIVGNNSTCANTTSSSYTSTEEIICNNRWYFVVISFDGSSHKTYVDGVLLKNVATLFNGLLICNSDLRFGNWWQDDPLYFNGKLDDIRWYNRAINSEEVMALFDDYKNPSSYLDFDFKQSLCNPKEVSFSTNIAATELLWDFGDGFTTASQNFVHQYSIYGNYLITLKVKSSYGCRDSLTRQIAVFTEEDPGLIKTNDTAICIGDSILLRPNINGFEFCWQQDDGLSFSNLSNPFVKPTQSSVYTLVSQMRGQNLVLNGDFSNGTSDFTSDYSLSGSGLPAGVFNVGASLPAWHPAMPPCSDHTGNGGSMLMVNGADKKNVKVWSQTISVTANTNYAFSTWLQHITSINPAQLQFSINGQQIGNIFRANSVSCIWDQFYTTWNSSNNTTAVISIVNMNEEFSGNDFALDDIFFGELSIKTDSVKVVVNARPEIDLGKDTIVCAGESIQLKAALSASTTIHWSPATFLDDPDSPEPISTPTNNLIYIAQASNSYGCFRKDTLIVNVIAKPVFSLRADTAICNGSSLVLNTTAGENYSYSWFPVQGISDATSPSPVAIPKESTSYTVTANNRGCSLSKSIFVTLKEAPLVNLSGDTTVCEGTHVQLLAQGGIHYKWSPSTYLSADDVPNPTSSPLTDILYKVSVTGDNGCTGYDSVYVGAARKPEFKINASSFNICVGESATLTAAGGDIYHWKMAVTPDVNSPSILVNPKETTTYEVTIADNECNMKDTLLAVINVTAKPELRIQKSNDIDCSNDKAQLLVTGADRYEWINESTLSNTFISNPIASPKETTVYHVKGYSNGNCYSSDSIKVNVLFAGSNPFYVPSAFTPNDDGRNDCFNLSHWTGVTQFRIEIFNRWGEKVFISDNHTDCWNGMFKNMKQPSGVYVYIVKAKTFCGDVQKKGMVTLIR